MTLDLQEEKEVRSDGTEKVLRPARLGLARVSVLRGDGSKEGIPFIDDHIHTSEVIVDYLTQYSGVKCKRQMLNIIALAKEVVIQMAILVLICLLTHWFP